MDKDMKVRDVMAREVVTLRPEDKLETAVQKLGESGFDGLPVTAKDGQLLGIVTEYDLVSHTSGMHLPTLLNVLKNVAVNREDQKFLGEYFETIGKITVRDIMNSDPLTVDESTPVGEVAKEFAEHHKVNPIPVVNRAGALVGIVSRYDIIRLFDKEYLHQVLKAASVHGEVLAPLTRRRTENQINSLVERLSEEYLFVNKMRPRFWKFFAFAMFIIGFMTSIAWIVRVAFK